MALAHELRALRCTVAPLIILPPEKALLMKYLSDVVVVASNTEAGAAAAVFVVCVDGKSFLSNRTFPL